MCLYVGREGFNRQQRFKKKRRKRTIFTCEQLSRLESEFADQQYVVGAERQQLAEVLNLSETQVRMGFSSFTWKNQDNVRVTPNNLLPLWLFISHILSIHGAMLKQLTKALSEQQHNVINYCTNVNF